MSQEEGIDLARRFFAAYNVQDVAALAPLLHPDARITTLSQRGGLPSRGWRGEEVQQYFDELDESWAEVQAEIEDYRASGDCVVALGHIRGTGRSSGVELDSPLATVFRVAGSRLARVDSYSDWGEALEAAGLGE
jgi:ketosteroid isomerase-like protein